MTLLRHALHDRTFVCVMEFVPKPSAQRFAALASIMARERLCDWPLAVSIGDRVASALDMSPLEACQSFETPVPTLLHFSGKDRERTELLAQLQRMDAAGLDQLLVLTGDRLPGHTPGQRPVRYLESVAALQIVRQARPEWLLGAALNPFKYCEEEGGAQYFKAEKKLAAGADFFILQLGFDFQKYREAMAWMQRQPAPRPMLACIMALTDGRAAMLEHVAGVTVSPAMRAVLAAEAAVSKAFAHQRGLDRLALQIIGLRLLGYAGINLSGVHTLEQFLALEQALHVWSPRVQSLAQWQSAWEQAWQMDGVAPVSFHPPAHHWQYGQREVQASFAEQARYRLLSAVHHRLFDRKTLLSKMFGWSVRRPLWSTPAAARLLHAVERSLKRPVVGCDTCGQCRLEDTLYHCPETCPKGLANGPCGGTQLNRCEFGDRECIHSRKYRTAVTVNQTEALRDRLIPCVEVGNRHRSSWPQWFDETAVDQSGSLAPQRALTKVQS
ncbi:methylenetetrahydrofolate reductase C-terminal domain-containing protein [Pseudomonas sp. S75]|uniref:methylenetetrahydrofolate reductase C-terminal domain-containing protein n=1 Tax=unclassified Pseudomonas TaxID=196821 RepID=UPI001908DCC8|nr:MULTISPECIES: methylenetetrahydrofolate reductase C-terminal domain-containing protein [unclassified Pseudomonas]MBJ9978124.1 methylenetetrahydrofolate reductase C-terminal domain-containing protein [Pseudomonas sp. S30]MBK0155955.1 methylenetetrahydrofolate reductase C-terminal domain-containing protein [Pseudomonas sp. S75]